MSGALERIVEELRRRGYKVEKRDNDIYAWHPEAPIALRVRVESQNVTLGLVYEGIRDFLDDLVEQRGVEEARDQIEEVLEDMSDLQAAIERIAREHGLRVTSRLRTDMLDVLEAFEDISEA